ncbi:ferrochelatase [Actinobacillus succinogenes]|uniref:Ferrochelatase n=1 Tax=Actinobacillus succinogenes (strain ATCC 55618 / DSM 22257 / CCUG 43843 / 130Z) TaxID=339671 RepID=A6VPL9_ACTSZ|nr:ferrochelatase [Actinobacillus succinogenes]ABR74916.1 Ferrochelatase [Actinobacillus succinogenes 130Z]PHI40673.1 ferrochelatase [Actinobacillus succinogenes]
MADLTNTKLGVLLINLGTPDEPTPKAISRYLEQFLTDPRIIDLARWKWLPLLKGIILPSRSRRISHNYQSVWTEQGSPLLAYSKGQKTALQARLQTLGIDAQVEIGMTYGNPSVQQALENLLNARVERIVALPLYPQYSSTTTAAAFDAFARALQSTRKMLPFSFIHSYHLDENYINSLTESIKVRLKNDEFLLFSYHGIPLRYEQEGDDYREYCRQTTLAVADKLGLLETQWGMVFQSRFGREEWLQPYADHFLQNAAAQGIEKIAVISPGFACDCLETLEEIAETNRDLFLANGGKRYHYIPALNDSPEHIEMMAQLIIRQS